MSEHSAQHHAEAMELLPNADPPLADAKGVIGLAVNILDFALRQRGDAVNESLVLRQFILHLQDVGRELGMRTLVEPEAHKAVEACQSEEIALCP